MSVAEVEDPEAHLLGRAVRSPAGAAPAGRVGRRGAREGGLPGVAGRMVELEAERGDERGVVEQRLTGLADEVRRDATAREERLEVDRGALDGRVATAGPLDLGDLEAAALGGLGDRLGLEHVRVERGGPAGERLAGRWNVLLVEPWTPGHAPVASEYQPAPVFGRRLGPAGRCPRAEVPFAQEDPIVGHDALSRVLRDEVLAHAVGR